MVLPAPSLSHSLLPTEQSSLTLQFILLSPYLSALGSPATAGSAAFSFLFLVTFELVTITVGWRIVVGSKLKKAIDTTAAVFEVAVPCVFHICYLFFVRPLVYFVCYSCWLEACRGYQGSLGSSPHQPFQYRGVEASQSLRLSFDGEAAWYLTL